MLQQWEKTVIMRNVPRRKPEGHKDNRRNQRKLQEHSTRCHGMVRVPSICYAWYYLYTIGITAMQLSVRNGKRDVEQLLQAFDTNTLQSKVSQIAITAWYVSELMPLRPY